MGETEDDVHEMNRRGGKGRGEEKEEGRRKEGENRNREGAGEEQEGELRKNQLETQRNSSSEIWSTYNNDNVKVQRTIKSLKKKHYKFTPS